MFLSEYPNGDVRKGARRLNGYRPHKRTVKKKAKVVVVPLSDTEDSDI